MKNKPESTVEGISKSIRIRYRKQLESKVAICCLLTVGCGVISPPAPALDTPFRKAFEHFVHSQAVMGGAYIVVDRDQIVERQNFGMADESVRQPVNDATIFHWASITKTLTAVAIMQLRDRGKLSLDDPIVKYVPELTRIHSQNNAISRVTIRNLLSHTGGFQGPTWPYIEGKPWEPFEPAEWSQLVAMMPYQEVAFEPGSKFQYSNPAFIYLAKVIETISGDPYQVYVQKNILSPLGMTHAYFNVTPYHLAGDRSNSYKIVLDDQGHETVQAQGREFDTGITTPNGGLNAPLGDMAKWIGFLSGSAKTDLPVLDRKSLMEMWNPVITTGDEEYAEPASMGLSFFLFPRGSGDDAVTFVGHTGHQAGFAAFFLLNPKNGKAVIAGFNTVAAWGEKPAAQKRFVEGQQSLSALMEAAMAAIR